MKKNVDFKNCSFFEGTDAAFTMIAVQGGTFEMGISNWEDYYTSAYGYGFDDWGNNVCVPALSNTVKLSDFWIGRYLVTQAVWQKVMNGQNPSAFKSKERPVESISWNDIVNDFLPKLNQLTTECRPKGTKFCLPTEAQWEYSATEGNFRNSFMYSGGNKLNDVAWYRGNSHGETKPVGLKFANLLGLYDMTGNVWEWCDDFNHELLYLGQKSVIVRNLQGFSLDIKHSTYRVLRGSCWDSSESDCKQTMRNSDNATGSSRFFGFRLSLFPIL